MFDQEDCSPYAVCRKTIDLQSARIICFPEDKPGRAALQIQIKYGCSLKTHATRGHELSQNSTNRNVLAVTDAYL